MSRDLNPTLEAALEEPTIRPIWIVRLDIVDDPVLAWTGRGDFQPVGTGDTALDGFTFLGLGNIGEIGAIQDTAEGSQALKLKLPGVNLTEPLLAQVVNDTRIWQFRQAWIWFGLLDSDSNIIINPFRIKTGRIDTMVTSDDGETGTIEVVIESHQSFAGRALGTRYSEQLEIDATDTSQNYVHDLANKQPGIGVASTIGAASGAGYEGQYLFNSPEFRQ